MLHPSPTPARPTRNLLPVTREMVQARTRELAVLAGRDPLAISQADYEQARRELTGENDMHRQEAVLDAPAQPASAAVASWENEGGQTLPPLPTQAPIPSPSNPGLAKAEGSA